jgi:phosphatidylglycerophosphate synthase
MFDDLLRKLKDRLLAPLAVALGAHIAPNVITLVACVAGLAAALFAWQDRRGLALLLWLANRVLDGLDGTQARVHAQQSDFGGYLDIVLDFVVYAAIPLALMLSQPALLIPGAFLLATFFVNAASWMYLAAILERRQAGASSRGELTTITMPPGIVAGTETVLFFTAMIVWPSARETLFTVMAALVMVNVVQRLWWARRHL